MQAEQWYLSLCCWRELCSPAFGPCQPHVWVSQAPGVPWAEEERAHVRAASNQAHTPCSTDCGQACRQRSQQETCHHTVRQIFKDLYYTPWVSDSACVALSGRFPTPQVVSLDSMAVSLKSRCRNCLEHTMPQAPIPISIFTPFRGLNLAVPFLTA